MKYCQPLSSPSYTLYYFFLYSEFINGLMMARSLSLNM